MKKYYFNDGKAQYGPFTLEELKPQINRETPIWYEGMSDWLLAKDLPEVSGVLPPPVPSAKMPPPVQQKPELLKITHHQEKKSISKWVWIIGGSVAGVAFFLWFTGAFEPHIKQKTPSDPTVIVDPAVNDESETIIVDENKEAEKEREAARVAEEKEAARIADEKERVLKLLICANFQQYFTAKVVSADVHDFGGMSDVFIEVRNLTDYHAEEVNLHLSYLKENGDAWKEERIRVTHVSPRQSMTVQAPGSHRGNKIRTRVEYVESKALGLREGYGYE